jgi:hypothetical protein
MTMEGELEGNDDWDWVLDGKSVFHVCVVSQREYRNDRTNGSFNFPKFWKCSNPIMNEFGEKEGIIGFSIQKSKKVIFKAIVMI